MARISLKVKYRNLLFDVRQMVYDKVLSTPRDKAYIRSGTAQGYGLKVNGEYYVEGHKITHITANELIADDLHYNYECMNIEELCEMVDNLPKK